MRPHNITDILMVDVDSGYSANIHGDAPTDGYMVGGEVPALVIDEEKNYQPYLTMDTWLERHWELLSKPGYYASIHTENDLIVVDITRNETDLYSALAIAASRGEYSVWDVAHGIEVHTEEGN